MKRWSRKVKADMLARSLVRMRLTRKALLTARAVCDDQHDCARQHQQVWVTEASIEVARCIQKFLKGIPKKGAWRCSNFTRFHWSFSSAVLMVAMHVSEAKWSNRKSISSFPKFTSESSSWIGHWRCSKVLRTAARTGLLSRGSYRACKYLQTMS